MTLLILECISRKERAREGMILFKFLTMPDMECLDIELIEFRKKKDLIKFLARKKNTRDFDFVHLSGHGSAINKHTAVFELPKGIMEAHDFPNNCFCDKSVTLSACQLGRTAFVDPFIEWTGPTAVIGPQKKVQFTDACVFWINYYFLVLQEGFKPRKAFEKTRIFLKKRTKGGFTYCRT